MKSFVAAAALCLFTTTAFAGFTLSPENVKVTYTHSGTGCFVFTVDKLPGVRFVLATAPKPLLDANGNPTGETATIFSNAMGEENDVQGHALSHTPFQHFLYNPDISIYCADGPGYWAGDFDTYYSK